MTDEERTAFKAEIVAELGRHLDEHYVKLSDVETHGKEFIKTVAEPLGKLIADLDDRISDVELTVALTDVHRRIDATDGKWWMWVADIRSTYAKRVRRRVAKWMVESTERFGPALDEEAQAKMQRLSKQLGRD